MSDGGGGGSVGGDDSGIGGVGDEGVWLRVWDFLK